ncbi:integrase [Enterovibrio nigricans]|nr:integrase [Enterovibrio nigricans]PKF50533.1 integrase [Enterovibrio nigricans]
MRVKYWKTEFSSSREKRGKKQIKLWSAELKDAVKECDNAYGVNSLYVIHQTTGSSFSRDGFNSRWKKARERARKETGLPLDFTFHDLKAKGISDYNGSTREKQIFSGHKTERQVATYDKKVEQVPLLNRQNITN